MNRVTVKLLDQHGINNMKVLVTQIMLPVAIFHALATAGYNKETGILVGIMFVMLVISFGIGFLLRILLQAAMIAGVLLAVHYIVGDHLLLNLAIISYMSAPATFSMQTFLKSEDGSAYVSTTNSLYCLVSILVYVIMAVVVY